MPTPTEISERLLLDSKAFNEERQILPSETAVIGGDTRELLAGP